MRQQHHHIAGLNYAHDFAMTPNYYVLQMTPFVDVTAATATAISAGLTSPGASMRYYSHLPSSIVLIPRSKAPPPPATATHDHERPPPAVRLIDPEHLAPIIIRDISPVHIFHFGHAHELPDGRVEFSAVCLPPPFDMTFERRVWLSNFTKVRCAIHTPTVCL